MHTLVLGNGFDAVCCVQWDFTLVPIRGIFDLGTPCDAIMYTISHFLTPYRTSRSYCSFGAARVYNSCALVVWLSRQPAVDLLLERYVVL